MNQIPGDELLTFEAQRWRQLGAKYAAIRERFGVSDIEYARQLCVLLVDPPPELAVKHAALIARRRRQMDAARRARRASWHFAG